MIGLLRRVIQLVAFAFAAFCGFLGFAPPQSSALLVALTSMLALCMLALVTVAMKPTRRARRLSSYTAIALAVSGGLVGLWYKVAYEEAVFVYQGDGHAHVAGTELTPNAQRTKRENPMYDAPSPQLLAAQGVETAVWTSESIARVRMKLTALFLAFVSILATAAFAAAERLRLIEKAAVTATPPRKLILFLAANPRGTSELALTDECAAIERELQLAKSGHEFDFRSKWAVGIDEMIRHLNDLQPTIIHFSGHGGGSSLAMEGARDFELDGDIGGAGSVLVLQDEQRDPQYILGDALAKVITSAAPSARLVVLNACYSDAIAEPLSGSVDCVVGMRGAIGDSAARSFAVGFYRAIANRRSVSNAVAQAVATLAAKQLPDEHLPVCRARAGLSADKIVLLGPET